MSTRKAIIYGVVAVLVAAMYFYSPRGDTPGAQAQSLVAAGAQLVDVRTPEEFAAGHIEGARNIPVDSLAARLGELGPPATVGEQAGTSSCKDDALVWDGRNFERAATTAEQHFERAWAARDDDGSWRAQPFQLE